MTETRPYDWDENRSANLAFLAAQDEFDYSCAIQEEAEAVFERYQAANDLRDQAALLRSRKHLLWSGERTFGGVHNHMVALNHLATLAHNGILEWRARRLQSMAQRLSEYSDAE